MKEFNAPALKPVAELALEQLNVIAEAFTEYPHRKRQSYCEHFAESISYAMYSGICCITFVLHGIFPFMLQDEGPRAAKVLTNQLNNRKKVK